jgi:multisubunit Na+/H+ antiporter MnhF subunit
MTADVAPDSSAIYVHFFQLSDRRAAHASLDELERLVVNAIATNRPPPYIAHAEGVAMTQATFVVLPVAAVLFAYRLCAGPSLADRMAALNGLVLVGMAGIATHATHTRLGSFLPTLVAIALVGPIGNGMVARFIEGRG